MRVLTILNWLTRGGIEITLLRSLEYLRNSDIHVDICCTGPKSALDEHFEKFGCKIYRIHKSINPYISALQLQRILYREKYQIVHSRFGYVSGGFALGAKRCGIPIIVSIHSAKATSLYTWDEKPLLRTIKRVWIDFHRKLMMRNVDLFLGHSHTNLYAFEPYWKKYPKTFRVLMNGIPMPTKNIQNSNGRKKLGIPEQKLVILHVGSFRPPKNHHGLLEIFNKVVEKRPDATLILVGDGFTRDAIQKRVQELKLSDHVRFEGVQTNVWDYYAAADVFLFPSEIEGLGNVLIESQATGTPIVASNIPAHNESVCPDQHKFLFPLPNYAQAAELVLELANAAEKSVNNWVNTSERYVRQNFQISGMANKLSKLYCEVIERQQNSQP